MRNTLRLAVLTSHPIQYQAPLWRALASRLDLTVFFCSEHGLKPSYDAGFGHAIAFDSPLLEGYRYEFLPNLSRRPPGGFLSVSNPSVVWRLQSFDAVLIRGYSLLTNWLAIAAARIGGKAVLMHVETPAFAARIGWKQVAKSTALGPVLRSMRACLAIGSQNRAFYESYGVRQDQISLVPYAVDNAFFTTAAERLAPERRELRHELGIAEEEVVALFVGKLMRRKHPELLIRALGGISGTERVKLRVLIVGTGEEERALRSLAAELDIEQRVIFAGFANQSELPRYYTAADVFVLPAEGEYWGLVVNEAMNFGLPLILGPEVAAADDLLREGENGFRLSSLDPARLANQILEISADPERRKRMGVASRAIVADWGIEQAADAIAHAVQRSVG